MMNRNEIKLQQEVFKQKLVNKQSFKRESVLKKQNAALRAALCEIANEACDCDDPEDLPNTISILAIKALEQAQ